VTHGPHASPGAETATEPTAAEASGVALGTAASASARIILVARVIGLVATLLGSVALARALGPEGRGAHAFFVATTVLLVTVTGLGLPVGAYILVTHRQGSRRTLLANGACVSLACGAIATALTVGGELAFRFLPQPVADVPYWPAALFLAVAGFAFNGHQLQLSLADGRALLGAFLSFGTYSLAAIGYVALLFAGGGLAPAVWIVAVAPYITAIVAGLLAGGGSEKGIARPDVTALGRTAREGIRFYPGELASMVHLRLDVVLLGLLGPLSAVGTYVVAYQTAEPILVIASAAQATILALGYGTEDGGRSLAVARLVRETIVLGLIVAFAAVLLGPFMIPIVFGDQFSASVLPFLVLLPAVLAMAMGRIAAADLMRRNRLEATVISSVSAMVLNIACNLVLIPPYGAAGAAGASLVSYVGFALLSLGYQRRASGRPWVEFVPRRADAHALLTDWRPRVRPVR